MGTASSGPFEFKIDIYTDTVCPFSYLGFLSLSRAISFFSSPATFSLTYHPYILYPTARPSSRELGVALTYIYSSHSHTTSISTRLDKLAGEYGIRFNWEGLTGNSRDSHRLLLLSQSSLPAERHQRFMERLFKTGFEDGGDISSRMTLAKLGVEAGLWGTEKEGMEWLESGELGEEVDNRCEKARREVGISAVPSYVVNNKWVVGGMQDQHVWEGLFSRIIAKTTKDTPEEMGLNSGGKEGETCHGRNCKAINEAG